MSKEYRVRGAGRGLVALAVVCIAGLAFGTGCTDFKKMVGLEPTLPDEFAVESRAPLTIPPDFDLRPPEPGAPRPQEKSAGQQAEQIIDQAGPGGAGTKEAADFRLRRGESGLPDIGGPQQPNPNGVVADQSLSQKLLGQSDTGAAGATVEKRETTPLKGVY
jgi:hypothetical protein